MMKIKIKGSSVFNGKRYAFLCSVLNQYVNIFRLFLLVSLFVRLVIGRKFQCIIHLIINDI